MAELSEASQNLLERFMDSLGLDPQKRQQTALVRRTATAGEEHLVFRHEDSTISDEDRFLNMMAVLLANIDLEDMRSIRKLMRQIDTLITQIDGEVDDMLHRVMRGPTLKMLEANWHSLDDLSRQVESEEVVVDFLDVTKEELAVDLEDHSSYILNSALFRKVYVDEYDQFGGKPFGCMVSLDYFDSSDEDLDWLRTMSLVGAAAHCPFIAGVKPGFFGVQSWNELDRESDLEALMSLPKFSAWNSFRESDAAAYIGLTLPRYMLRRPWEGKRQGTVTFNEKIRNADDYLWGSAAILLARNMIRSFENSGWCQHIAGPRGGGLVRNLPVHTIMHHGHEELQPPVEFTLPDYRELQFSRAGFMPVVYQKGTADVCFFSTQSVKKPLVFEDDTATKNADLVTNLSYTMSVTRLAHYVKRMVRDYIGSTADGPYIQTKLEEWLIDYVTTVVNPDDLTLLYYPFKAMAVEVTPRPGPFGWYNCVVSVLPHAQFQGMDVELRLEAALGGA